MKALLERQINVMAPLFLTSEEEWQSFKKGLQTLKELGVHGISTDVWWGVVEKVPGIFDWEYYDRILESIAKANLRWIPILSFHACGMNPGDTRKIPLPSWIWEKGPSDLRYVSELGNTSDQAVSVWGTDYILEDYERFMKAFSQYFFDRKNLIQETIIGLGPAGELRYPSYDAHDPYAHCPNAGYYQASSSLAIASFERSGMDFSSWYHLSLIDHGKKLLETASSIFRDQEIGCKIPGIHWRATTDRKAEIHAGLISETTKSYEDMMRMIKSIKHPIHLHFTCLEQDDHAKKQVLTLLAEAQKYGVSIKGENALESSLQSPKAWENMEEALLQGYKGLTLLRMEKVLTSSDLLQKLIQRAMSGSHFTESIQ